MNKVNIEVPNGILFIVDPTNNETIIPTYSPDDVAASTDTCVSVATQIPEDGETEVYLGFDYKNSENYNLVFNGGISINQGVIAIVTAELESLLEINVPNGKQKLQVFVDNVYHPAVVVVNLLISQH